MKDKRHRPAALQGGYLLHFICEGCSKVLESGRFTTLPGIKAQAAFNRLRKAHGHGDTLCCGSCCPGNAESGAAVSGTDEAASRTSKAPAPPAKPEDDLEDYADQQDEDRRRFWKEAFD